MANRRKPFTFAELDGITPKGKGAILRTAAEVAADEEILDAQEAAPHPDQSGAAPAQTEAPHPTVRPNQKSGNTDLQNPRKPESQYTGNPDGQFMPHGGLATPPPLGSSRHLPLERASYDKVTYRLRPEAIDAMHEAKRRLRREYGLKVNLEEIAEEAILHAYEMLLNEPETNYLVRRLAHKGGAL